MSTYANPGSYDGNLTWSRFAEALQGATDSAAAATAMASGYKTYRGAIGMVPDKDGSLQPVENLVERAEKLGKASGVLTSVPFAHATPAAFVVHNPNRKNFQAIANDLLRDSALEVLIGCGHPFYDRNGQQLKTARKFDPVGGAETWQALQTGEVGGDADGDNQADPWTLIQKRADFQQLASGPTPQRLLGIPQVSRTLQQDRSGNPQNLPYAVPLLKTVPNLTELARAALNVLDNDPDGFFLMIEGGAVDWASHDNQSSRMLEEQLDFDRTVAAVVRWVETHSSWNETLLIVTGDHETGSLTGPGSDPEWRPLVNRGRNLLPGMEWQSGYHTNNLIPLFAKGQGAKELMSLVQGHDPVRGPYVDNTAVAKAVFAAFE
jgi:alkaline phosphatase